MGRCCEQNGWIGLLRGAKGRFSVSLSMATFDDMSIPQNTLKIALSKAIDAFLDAPSAGSGHENEIKAALWAFISELAHRGFRLEDNRDMEGPEEGEASEDESKRNVLTNEVPEHVVQTLVRRLKELENDYERAQLFVQETQEGLLRATGDLSKRHEALRQHRAYLDVHCPGWRQM